jgi:hypothetical protein
MTLGQGRAGRGTIVASVVVTMAAMVAAARPAAADYDPPRGHQAIGYGPEGLAGQGYGHGAWYAWPYHSKSALYGYSDFAYGRGPIINLGSSALQPGFRGYGVFGSPGYGLGMYPSTWTDQRPSIFGHHSGYRPGPGHGDGHWHGR